MKIKYNMHKIMFLMGTGLVLIGCEKEGEVKLIPVEIENESTNEMKTEVDCLETEIELIETESTEIKEIYIPTEELESETELITEAEIYSDEQVIDYINELGGKMDECTDKVTISFKKHFITVVDFLFYGGTIGGRTFDSLSDSAKVKALNAFEPINTYIDTKFPNFKPTLGEKYGKVTEYLDEKKEKVMDWLGEEKVDTAEEYLDKGKDIYNKSKEKVKKWYEKFRENNKNGE